MKKGFTLIELLVVVLIIGILAAVALPQYQAAVEKSRAAEALIILKNAQQARVLDYLEKGPAPSAPQDIMEFSGGTWSNNGSYYCTKHFTYAFEDVTCLDALRVNNTNNTCPDTWPEEVSCDIYLETPYSGEGWENRKNCSANDDLGYKVCKGLESQGFTVYDDR